MTNVHDAFTLNAMNRKAETHGFTVESFCNGQFKVVADNDKWTLYGKDAARWYFNTAEEVLAFLTGFAESQFYKQQKEKENVADDGGRTRGNGAAKRSKPNNNRKPAKAG